MFNYKKSLLSIATVTALAVSTLSAGYIPLTNASGNDEEWVLFGVTGLKATGAGSGTTAGTFSIADSTASALEDTTLDELFVEGLLAATGEELAKVKILSPYSQVEVRVDTTGAVYNETEPVRTMYVTLTEGGSPSFAFTYRASLEGLTMQYSVVADGSAARTLTISSENTYNNPAYGEVIQEVAGLAGSSLADLADLVDYDFSDNPTDSAYYDEDTDRTLAAGTQYLRAYSYDATTAQWDLFDSRNTVDANDFNELEKGKAYWAKMDDGGAGTVGGLVLGSGTLSAADYTAAGVTDGWNLMSFDNSNPDIRKSSTGLILTVDVGTAANVVIYDSSANHSVTVAITDTNITTMNTSAKLINSTIKQAKLDGELPETFDLKGFALSATELVLLSSNRFFIEDSDTTSTQGITTVTTLTGANPYTVDMSDITQTVAEAVTDLGETTVSTQTYPAVMSKYGEYALLVEPLVGDAGGAPWDTAAAIAADAARVHIQSAASDASAVSALSMSNLAGVAAAITATVTTVGAGTTGVDIGGYDSHAYGFDSDYNDVADLILLASDEPFYVRDHTFTRVFDFTDNNDTAGIITTAGTGTDLAYTDAAAGAVVDAQTFAAALDGAANGVHVTEDAANAAIIVIASADSSNEFVITENTSSTVAVDQLEDTASTDAAVTGDSAKGAIKGVYSLEAFTKATPTNTATVTMTNFQTVDGGCTVDVQLVNTLGGIDATTTYVIDSNDLITYPIATNADAVLFANEIKQHIESALSTAGITATVTNTNSATITAGTFPIFTIVSPDIDTVGVDFTTAGGCTAAADIAGGATATVGGDLLDVTADLSDDLKFNAVYTPNYVNDGPLYTMKETGFTLKAVVTGTTDISDGSVNWDSVDLTRTPSDWLDSQDYNLFSVSEDSGYWAFVETDAGSNELAISNAQLNPVTYTYRFNEVATATKLGTNYSSVSANVALTIDGLDTDTRAVPVVSVTVAGSEVELANVAGTNSYTGKASSYEIENMTAGYNYEVLANIADGLGYNLKSEDTTLEIDYLKPDAPTIDLGDGTTVTLSSSDDAAGYYVFNGQIPEESTSTASNLLKKLTAAEAAAGYGLCQETDKLDWFDSLYDLNVIAIDGTGVLGGGNASDTKSVEFIPTLKDSIRLEDTANSDYDETFDGSIYGADCTETGTVGAVNTYGVSITSMTDLQTVRAAYEPTNIASTTATPISLFFNNAAVNATVIGKIEYQAEYVGTTVYVELEGTVYSLVLPSEAELVGDDSAGAIGGNTMRYGAAAVGLSIADPLDLNDGFADEDTTLAGVPASTGYAEEQTGVSLNPAP